MSYSSHLARSETQPFYCELVVAEKDCEVYLAYFILEWTPKWY